MAMGTAIETSKCICQTGMLPDMDTIEENGLNFIGLIPGYLDEDPGHLEDPVKRKVTRSLTIGATFGAPGKHRTNDQKRC